MASNDTGSSSQEFFDLHVRGYGYLNRPRLVHPRGKGNRRSDPFLACAINALHGSKDDPNTSYFDCRVSGTDAQAIVQALIPEVEADKKVLVAFVIGDIYAHHYERNASGSQQKEIASLIKGRLLQITCVKVDGEVVYRLDRDSGLVTTTLNLAEAPAKRTGTDG